MKKKTLSPSAQDLKIQCEIQFSNFFCWSKRSKKNFTIEIWTSLFKTAFKINFGYREVVKLKICANTYLLIFSLTPSQSPKLILKAVLKWESPYFIVKKTFRALWPTQKIEKWICHCIFKSCAEGFRGFCQSGNFFTKRIYLLNSRRGRQTSDFDFTQLSE